MNAMVTGLLRDVERVHETDGEEREAHAESAMRRLSVIAANSKRSAVMTDLLAIETPHESLRAAERLLKKAVLCTEGVVHEEGARLAALSAARLAVEALERAGRR